MGYLDGNGVLYLWSKVKALFNKGITGLSVKGTTITYTKGDGSTGSFQTQDTAYDYYVFEGATESNNGSDGLVPEPAKGEGVYTLFGNGKWHKQAINARQNTNAVTLTLRRLNRGSDETGVTISDVVIASATTSQAGMMSAADKTKLSTCPTRTEVENTYAKKAELANMYKYCGSVSSADKLPTTDQQVGDVYNVETASEYGGAGMNVAWNGSAWDPLGEIFTITAITNAEIDAICV